MNFPYAIKFILLLLFISVYFIQVPKSKFTDTYKTHDIYFEHMQQFKNRKQKVLIHNDVQWKYYVSGKGKMTILFLHGMGGAAEIWWNQIIEFEKTYKVIAYTLPEQVHSLQAAENGILSILSKEGIDQFYVVGTSMGGYIAQCLMEKYPQRVKKAVLGNTFPPNELYQEKNDMKRKVAPLLPGILLWYIGKNQLKKEIVPAGGNNKLLEATLLSLPFNKRQIIGRYDVVIDKFTPNQERKEITKIPKLIIESDNDPLIYPILRKKLKQLYADAQVYTFHNQGHFPYINAEKKYNEILHTFLDSRAQE